VWAFCLQEIYYANMNIEKTDLHRFDLRYQHTRVVRERVLYKLMRSIKHYGQQSPVIAVTENDGLVLIDGYLRFQALHLLGEDTIMVQIASHSVQQGLLNYLSQQQCGVCQPIEQAWIINSLINEGMTQMAVALRMGRDKSWVSRRLSLVTELPEDIQQAIRSGAVSAWVAERVFKPLAHANAAHAKTLLNALKKQPMSSRELSTWFDHYNNANQGQRAKMVQEPDLLLRVLHAEKENDQSITLQAGSDDRWLHDIKITKSLIKRLMKPLPQLFNTQPMHKAVLLEDQFAALDQAYTQLKTQFQEVDNAYRRDPEHHFAATCETNTDQADHAAPENISQHSAPSDSQPKTCETQTKEVAARCIEAARALLAQ